MALKRTIAIAFITVVIDMMGLGISFPILPILFSEETTVFKNLSATKLGILYGFLQACFAIAQFIGAPILGRLSDKYGRKRMLLLSLFGAMIGYLSFAYGVYTTDLTFMFIGRLIPGFAGGNVAIMYSSLADVSSGDDKLKNFGLAGAGFGLGMILGPVAGGLLSDASYVSWFNFETPFLFMASLMVLNFAVVAIWFRETSPASNQAKTGEPLPRRSSLGKLIGLGRAFRHPQLSLVFVVVLIHASGFSFFLQFVHFYMIDHFDFNQSDIGLMFGYVGIWTVLTQGVLIRPIANRFPPERIVANAIIFFALSLLALLLPSKARWLFLILPVMTIFQGFYMPSMTALISNWSDESIQGEMLGINQALNALSNAIPPIAGGFMLAFGTRAPLLLGAGLIITGWLVFNVFYSRVKRGELKADVN